MQLVKTLLVVLVGCGRIGFAPDGAETDTNIPTGGCFPTVSLGLESTFGIDHDGALWAWGGNYYGQLGLLPGGDGGDRLAPERVPNLPAIQLVVNGFEESAAVDTSGVLHRFGYLAGANPQYIESSGGWASLRAGVNVLCGIKTDHSLWCWGIDSQGQTGNGTATNSPDSVAVQQVGTESDWAIVAPGSDHMCALKLDGRLFCWGDNDYGELGSSVVTDQEAGGVQVPGTWLDVAVGEDFTAAIAADHSLWGWGFGPAGGQGYQAHPVPMQIGVDADWLDIAGMFRDVCARKGDTTIWCWGEGATMAQPLSGTPVYIGATSGTIIVGGHHQCLLDAGHAWRCWGDNARGEIGDGTTTKPTMTVMPCPVGG